MAEFQAPGIFIEEIGAGPRPIEGVPTSVAALLGEAERGQIVPRLVTGIGDYRRHFGAAEASLNHLPGAIRGFFENGGQRAVVCRVAGAGAAAARAELGGFAFTAAGPGVWGNRIHVAPREAALSSAGSPRFGLDISCLELDGSIVAERFDDLEYQDPEAPDHFVRRVNGESALVTMASTAAAGLPAGEAAQLSGGADGGAIDWQAACAALEDAAWSDVTLVAAPGLNAPEPLTALVDHCERMRRFAVIDCARADPRTLDPRRDRESAFAACYAPWIAVAGPAGGQPVYQPPSGHVLGVYSRVDLERGVWKAPANEVLVGALGVEHEVDAAVQALLNPRGVNLIRRFPDRGIRLWGARTLSADPLWKYVSVRRLFLFLERSIEDGTAWAVFEPNGERLWARIGDSVRLFLRRIWRDGALMGTTEDEAFYIRCDRSTMTQDDIDGGRLIAEIGVAAMRPAEFMSFRIFRSTGAAH